MALADIYSASQTERVTLIKVALLNKVGEGGVRHLGLTGGEAVGDVNNVGAQDTSTPAVRASQASGPGTATTPDAINDGIHLWYVPPYIIH